MEDKKTKPVLIRLDPKIHNRIRHISIDTGISINTYVSNALKEIIKNYEKKEAQNDK